MSEHAIARERIHELVHEHGLDKVVLSADVERWIRWAARALSVVTIAITVAALVEYGPPRGHDYVAWEETASIAALAFATAGLLIAWFWEPLGASLAIVAGAFVGALGAYQYSLLIAVGVAALYLLPAGLFLLAWQRTQSWVSVIVIAVTVGLVLALTMGMAYAFYYDAQGPTHGASSAPALVPSPVEWIWSGGVTGVAAVVVASVPDGTDVSLTVWPEDEPDQPTSIVPVSRGSVYRFEIDGLIPGVGYRYAVEVDGELDDVRTGSFATPDPEATRFVVAFASCARVGSNGQVFDTIRDRKPDLFINTGDFFYGDVQSNNLDAFSSLFDVTLTQPGQHALYRSTPIAYVWDDHDYGPNDAAKDSPSRPAALVSYRAMVPHYPFALEGDDAPIAQAFTLGPVRFIMTDTRSARDPKTDPDGPEKSMLGAEQLEWFLGELDEAMRSHEVVVWVNSVPWIAEAEAGADHWGGYTHERTAIANAIADMDSDRLIMLTGDAHMVAIDDGSHSDYSDHGEAGFPVMNAAALDRGGSVKGGPYSHGAVAGGGQFGLMTIERTDDRVDVLLQGLTWENDEIMSLSLSFPTKAQ